MALFSSNPEKVLQRDFDSARTSRDAVAKRLATAQQLVTEREATLCRLAGEGAPDDALATAERGLSDSERRVETLARSLTEADAKVVKLNAELAAIVDKKQRAATSAELLAMAIDLEQANAGVDIAMNALSKIATRAAVLISEAKGLEIYAASSLIQVPEAVGYVGSLLRERARLVIDGSAPASLPTSEAAFVPAIPAKPVTRRLFALRAISWTDANGDLRVSQKWHDADLPIPAAERAIATNACVSMHDRARSQQTLRQWPGHPDPANCFSLDDPNAAAPADTADEQPRDDAVLHSGFVESVGQPYQLRAVR
jgi:hypothetical protein